MSVASRIKEMREHCGLSRGELAKKVGVTVGAISNYENGVSSPKEPILFAIIETLGCDANYLFQDVVNIPQKTNNVTVAEFEIVKNYRSLDQHGKETVDSILSIEMKRMRQLKITLSKEHDKSKESTAFQDKLQTLKAAHNDFADDEEEQKLIREDLEDMENNW